MSETGASRSNSRANMLIALHVFDVTANKVISPYSIVFSSIIRNILRGELPLQHPSAGIEGVSD